MKVLLLALALALGVPSFADTSDEDADKALKEVMDMLVTPAKREELLKTDTKAKQADDFALQVGGTKENQQKIYELSAKIMKDLAAQGKKDPDAMMKVLEAAKNDPEAFAKTFSPEQQKELNALASDIARKQSKAPKTP